MSALSAFPIAKRWPAKHPDRLQLYSVPTPNGVKVSIALEEIGLPYEPHAIDIGKNEKTKDATLAQVFSDVDSAYNSIAGTLNLLRPYKEKYLAEAAEIRDTVEFSYRQGGSTLLDYLDSEKAYRDVQLAYLNLIGNYLTAAAQMNMAVGREVLQ